MVLATFDMKIEGECVMPAGYRTSDHQLFVIDIHTGSILGDIPQWIVQPQAFRLNCQILGVVEKYIKCLETLIDMHRLIKKVGRA